MFTVIPLANSLNDRLKNSACCKTMKGKARELGANFLIVLFSCNNLHGKRVPHFIYREKSQRLCGKKNLFPFPHKLEIPKKATPFPFYIFLDRSCPVTFPNGPGPLDIGLPARLTLCPDTIENLKKALVDPNGYPSDRALFFAQPHYPLYEGS
jgi:hypothetical protein